MSESSRFFLAGVLAILCSGLAFYFSSDAKLNVYQGQIKPGSVAVSGDWSSAGVREGNAHAVESRVMSPRLNPVFPASDTYKIQFYYVLKGEKPAQVLVSGRRTGQLVPTSIWRRYRMATPFVRAGEPLALSFEIPSSEQLIIRRIKYTNYYVNLGHLLLVKAKGGARSSVHAALLVLLFAGLIVIWMASAFFARQRSMRTIRPGGFFLPAGAVGVFILLFQRFSPYEVHADAWFLTGVFWTLAAASVVTSYFPRIRVRVVAKRFALVSMGLLIALGVAEVALRIWNPRISRPGFRNHMRVSPEYGWTNRPGAEGMNVNLGYHIKINPIGHRGPNYSFEKKPGVFRILGLGDSFTFGVGVEEKETFLRQLEQNLRKKNYKVEIINAGVAGWHSVQSLHYLRKEKTRFQPDLVLMNFYVNDMDDTTMVRLRNHPIAIRTRAEETSRRRQTGLSRYSRLYSTWANSRKIQKAARDLRMINPYRSFEDERKGLLANFDKRGSLIVGLEKMVAAWAKERDETGVPIVFTYIPPGGAIGAQDYQGESRALSKVSRAYHIPYVDLVSPFEKHPDPRTLYLFPLDGHLSPAGHALMAKVLMEFLLKRRMIPG